MIEITTWAEEFAQKLSAEFGQRLLFLGYQGSYGRGEATETSDIDIVCILDRLELADLAQYRQLAGEMPSHELCCGFICGLEELRGWPKYDLLALMLDTKPVRGELGSLVEAPGPGAAKEALNMGASGLYHAACHSFLYGDRAGALPELRKAVFFCLRTAYLARTGEYVPAKRELLEKLSEPERQILTEANPYQAYRLMIDWSAKVLRDNRESD